MKHLCTVTRHQGVGTVAEVGGFTRTRIIFFDTFAPTSARKTSSFPRGASKEQSSVFSAAQTANVKCFRECFRILVGQTQTFIELHKFRGGCPQPCSRNQSIINGCLGEAKTPSSTQNPPRDSLWGETQGYLHLRSLRPSL